MKNTPATFIELEPLPGSTIEDSAAEALRLSQTLKISVRLKWAGGHEIYISPGDTLSDVLRQWEVEVS